MNHKLRRRGKGACVIAHSYDAMSHAMKGHPTLHESQWKVLTKLGPLEENGKPLQFSCMENLMNSKKRKKKKDVIPEDEFPRLKGVQYATREVKVKVTQSCPSLCDPTDCTVCGILQARTGVGSRFLLQKIFLTQGSNPGLPHYRWILHQLSHQGSPRILEWIAYPFSSRSFLPKNRTRVSCIAGGFFTS